MENVDNDFDWKRSVKFGKELVDKLNKDYRTPYTFKLVKAKYGIYHSLEVHLSKENLFLVASEVKIIFGSGTRIKTYFSTIDKVYELITNKLT